MENIDSYIVRVYKRSSTDPSSMTGIVEDVSSQRTTSFKNISEMIDIISKDGNSAPQNSAKTTKKRGRQRN